MRAPAWSPAVAEALGEVYEGERLVLVAALEAAEQLAMGHPLRGALLELARRESKLEQLRASESFEVSF